MASTTGATINVVTAGTLVPLPQAHILPAGITVDVDNETISVTVDGTYVISFSVNLAAAEDIGARLLIDGTPEVSATIEPGIPRDHFYAQTVLIFVGTTLINLELFGDDVSVTLNDGLGAQITIMRVE